MIRERLVQEVAVRRETPAYKNGWEDGRFGPAKTFLDNANLSVWSEHGDRLAYYRGHRDGRRIREMLVGGRPA